MFERIASLFVSVLIPFLVVSTLVLITMLVFLVLQRVVDEFQFQRRKRLTARYRPVVDALLSPDRSDDALLALARVPRADRDVIETMLLKPLALATGSFVDRLREGARATGLVEDWAHNLSHSKWWVRAEAARALGLVRESRALPLVFKALDDEHEEVRAAAVEALGLIGQRQAIPVLLERLPDETRHQRARIVEALREFGDVATPALVEHARKRPGDAVVVADILGLIGGHVAAEELQAWMNSPDGAVRTAALRGLGTIGLDDDGAVVAMQALEDAEVDVRAMAARAIGRATRHEAAPTLARHLDDEWVVAASCADALRRLGRPGLDALQARAGDPGYAGDLVRQMLWERRTATAGA
ncbi:MAG: HEAT repeat domain-containing protein [Acidobacteria bacterium]|nr:HEAT repeat domain-containing protein [Acidobacteriota bacterium]